MKKRLSMVLFCILFLLAGAFSFTKTSLAESVWTTVSTGMNSNVNALAVYNNELYAGGNFTNAGGSSANYIAKWNGTAWSAVGSGFNAQIRSLAVYNNELYAGGDFTVSGAITPHYIARWNGTTWNTVTTGTNNNVYALVVNSNDNKLYVGGDFISPGFRIASWNGTSWGTLSLGVNDTVEALSVYNNELYAGGRFTSSGGSPAYIAKWTGVSWSSLVSATGTDNEVLALGVFNNELYAGGYFTTIGGTAANYLAKWNGTSFSAVSSGVSNGINYNSVNSFGVHGSLLYFGGNFTMAGGVSANRVAKFDGTTISAVGTGMDGIVLALGEFNSELYAGGVFTNASGTTTNNIAKLTETTPTPTPEPTAVEIQQQNLIAGRRVKLIKALKKETIAGQDLKLNFKKLPTKLTKGGKYYMKWNKTNKYPKGVEKVKKMAMKKVWKLNTNLKKYKAKTKKQNYKIKTTFQYTDAEFKAMKKEAKKKGNKVNEGELLLVSKLVGNDGKWFWTPVTSIWPDVVLKHNIENNTITFEFTKESKKAVVPNLPNDANFAIIDSGYSAVGEGIGGVDSQVNAFAVYNGDLYVGGKFRSIGGERMNNIARWDGTSWTAVGNARRVGVNDHVDSLQVYNGDLYVGGKFTETGTGVSVNHLAKWDDHRWGDVVSRNSTLDLPSIPTIDEMEVYNGELYLLFLNLDEYTDTVYRWDGSFFRRLQDREGYIHGFIHSLEVYNGDLYISGSRLYKYGDSFGSGVIKWNDNSFVEVVVGFSSLHALLNSETSILKVYDNRLYLVMSGSTRNLTNGYELVDGNFRKVTMDYLNINEADVDGDVFCLEGYGNKLYAGGGFETMNRSGFFLGAANGIISLDVSDRYSWSDVGYGLWNDGEVPVVNAMISHDGYLFIGGKFTGSGGLDFNNIARYRAID